MSALNKDSILGVIGAGTMGSGIAQVAAAAGHNVVLWDENKIALSKALTSIESSLKKLAEKGKLSADESKKILGRISIGDGLNSLAKCGLVIEAIIEDLKIKKDLFSKLETLVAKDCVLASNTSSLSIASISAACSESARVIGIHFFNPPVLMPLVEVIPGIKTDAAITKATEVLLTNWGKAVVVAKDTPGFIVNRVARPFYSESLRILEEGIADSATIDWALKELGGFKMGPFELMDLIGNDINFAVTSTVFESFFYDSRYRPALTQKRLVEAGMLGRKSGRGYYDYSEDASKPNPKEDRALGTMILNRVLCMLINEAIDAVYLNVATPSAIDTAMTKGVNYPKGLLRWAEEIGLPAILESLERLKEEYSEDRYRASPLLKRMVREGSKFY